MTLYNSVQLCTTQYNSAQLCTTLHNSVQLCTTLYNSVQLCTTLYNSVQLCTTLLYFWNSTIYRRDTRGRVMPKHLDFKKRDKDEKTYTFSWNIRKVLRNKATNKGVYIEFETPSSPRNDTSQKTRNIPWSSPMFVINSLTAIGAHERQRFNKLRGNVVSRRVFIRSQSLIARWMRNDLILAAVACDLYEACRINDVSRGSKSYLVWAS